MVVMYSFNANFRRKKIQSVDSFNSYRSRGWRVHQAFVSKKRKEKKIQEEQFVGVKLESSIYKKVEKKLKSSIYNLKLEKKNDCYKLNHFAICIFKSLQIINTTWIFNDCASHHHHTILQASLNHWWPSFKASSSRQPSSEHLHLLAIFKASCIYHPSSSRYHTPDLASTSILEVEIIHGSHLQSSMAEHHGYPLDFQLCVSDRF